MQTLHDIAYLQRWLGSFNVQGLLLMSRYGSSTSTASALSLPLSRTPCARSPSPSLTLPGKPLHLHRAHSKAPPTASSGSGG